MTQEIRLKVGVDAREIKKALTFNFNAKDISKSLDAALDKLTTKTLQVKIDFGASIDAALKAVSKKLQNFNKTYSGELASITDDSTQAGEKFEMTMLQGAKFGTMAVSAYAGLELVLTNLFKNSGIALKGNLDALAEGFLNIKDSSNAAYQSGNTFLDYLQDVGIIGQEQLKIFSEYLDTFAGGISGSISDLTLAFAKLFPTSFSFILSQIQSIISMFQAINVAPFLNLLGLTSPTLVLIGNTLVKAVAFRGTMTVFTTAFGLFKDFAGFLFPKMATFKDALTGIGNVAIVLNNMFTVRISSFMGWLKTFGAMIAAGASWFFGLPAMVSTVFTSLIIKSGLGVAREKLTRFVLTTAASLGSARAQLVLIALNLKDIALPVTNMLYALIKSKGVLEGITQLTKGIGQNSGKKVYDNIVNFISKLIEDILKKINVVKEAVSIKSSQAGNIIKSTFKNLFPSIKSTLSDLTPGFAKLGSVIKSTFTLAGGAIKTVSTGIKNIFGKTQSSQPIQKVIKVPDPLPVLPKDVKIMQSLQDVEKALATAQEKIKKTSKKMGEGITKEISQGIASNANAVVAPIENMGKKIKRRLPHSPAEEGPLVGLRTWGAHIVDEISFGIMSNVVSFKDAIFTLSNKIAESIKPLLEVGHISERVGVSVEAISQLQHALIGYDVTVQDLQMTFNSLKSTLQTINDDAKIATLANVGIDLDKVRAAADPTLELFYQLADSARKFPVSSLQMKNALESLGVNIQSNLVNALAMGRDQITAMMAEANMMGATVDESFIKIGFTFNETLAKLNKLWIYLEKEFIAQIMPYLDSINKKLLSIYEDNAPKIRALVRIAGQVFEQILKMLSNIIKTAWANPDQILDFVMNVIVGIWGAIKAYLKAALTDATQGMTYYGLAFIRTLVISTWDIAKEYGSLAWTLAYGKIMDIFTGIETRAYSLLKKFSDSVFGKAWLSDSARETINKLNEQALAGQEDAVVQMYQAAEATNMRVGYIVKSAQQEIEQSVLGMMDEDVQKQSIERFANAGKEAKEALQGIYSGTVFEEPIIKAIENIKKAVSEANFDNVKKDIEDGIQTISIDVEEKINQPIQHLQGTLAKVGDAAKKGKDNIVGMMEATQREMRISNLFADMRSRIDRSDGAQNRKALLELKNRHVDELNSLRDMLAAKYKLNRDDVERHKDFLNFKKQQEIEFNLTMGEQDRQRILNQSQLMSDSFGNFSQAINTVYEETGKRHKALFYMSKALALSQAIINTALAVVNAFAQGGPFLGPALGAMAGAAGAVQIGVIMAQTIKGFAFGGLVRGKNEGNKDTIPAKLTVGEYVIPRDIVNKYGVGVMESLRSGIIPHAALQAYRSPASFVRSNAANYNLGGIVKTDTSKQSSQPNQATIVNVVDPNLLDSLLATTQGRNSILNIISANASTIRHSLAIS